MRTRVWLLLLVVVYCNVGFAQVRQAQYGVAKTFDFKLYNTDGTLDVDEADGGSEVVLFCDEGDADGTVATNDFVDETNFYSIALTAAEMACARLAVDVGATTREVFLIETFGSASAQNESLAGPPGFLGIVDYGTAQSATATTLVLRSAAAFANDEIVGGTILLTGGTGLGQSRTITDHVSASDTATVDTWTTTPSGTITYIVFGTSPNASATPPTPEENAAATWDMATSGHTTAGTFGEQLKVDVDAVLDDTGTSGVAVAPDGIGAGQIDAGAGTELGSAVWASATRTLTGTQTFNLTGNITGNLVGTVSTLTTYTGNTLQTGDSFARIGALGVGLTALTLDGQVCEDAPATDITCRGAFSLLLAEALGPGAFTAGSPDTWVVKDPSNAVTRLTITYGTDNGDRNTPTIVPDAP